MPNFFDFNRTIHKKFLPKVNLMAFDIDVTSLIGIAILFDFHFSSIIFSLIVWNILNLVNTYPDTADRIRPKKNEWLMF